MLQRPSRDAFRLATSSRSGLTRLHADATPDVLRASHVASRSAIVLGVSEPEPGPLLEDLNRTLRLHMLRELPVDASCTLRDLNLRSLHSVYATWRGRVPAAVPRTVHLSTELLASPDRNAYSNGLAATVREISSGVDLRPRLSTAVAHAYKMGAPPLLARRRGARHRDRLLADWGIHHLHLSSDPHPRLRGFLRRTPHVLLTAFYGDIAYLIDLRPHESDGANWSELAILRTIVKNWPDSGLLIPSDFITGLSGGNRSDEERRELRLAGIAGGIVEIDGRVWMARGGGQTLAGTPMPVERHCMAVSWFLAGHQPTGDELRSQLTTAAKQHGIPDQHWRAHVSGENFGFLTEGLFIRYGSLVP